jgi:hypothetical protein
VAGTSLSNRYQTLIYERHYDGPKKIAGILEGIYQTFKPFKPYKEEYMEYIVLGVLIIVTIGIIALNVWFGRM